VSSILPWITANFELRGVVYIIRHPLAVVASQMDHPNFKTNKSEVINDKIQTYLQNSLPHLVPYIEKWSYEEEWHATAWCFEQHIPLSAEQRWLTIHYEELILNESTSLQKILKYLSVEAPESLAMELRQPSSSTKGWSADPQEKANLLLSTWKKLLTQDQISRVLAVVERFGIQGYGEDVVPDFEKVGVK
jgi:hypothetical protein